MKRISALVLALIICAVALPAHASELDFQLGSAFACGFDTFRLYFDALTADSGYAFSWDESTLEAANGVKLHTAANEDRRVRYPCSTSTVWSRLSAWS